MFHNKDATLVTGIILNVRDLEKMKVFYESVLGLDIIEQDHEHIQFRIGKSEHTITLKSLLDGRTPSMREAGLFHVALLLPTRSDLANFLVHVSRLNVQIGAGDHIVSEALYLNDPEGNGIEVYCDRDSQSWNWKNGQVKMDTVELNIENLIQASSNNGWNRMPNGAVLGHLHLKTHDIEEAKPFYLNILNLDVVVGNFPKALFMSSKDYHHHIAINTWQSHKKLENSEASYGISRISMQVPNLKKQTLISPEGLPFDINKQ
ncbi:VOC family protein [Mammaliicoccus stepanovicii]|uniref:Glyoxalase n=1 Tax=Mammaliicoccus stepanovicii TaxID=643214 RepID=A0A239YHS0_9STAP|nr:VOC family protein [Mammaliicoccus stepanovicii]PNZ75792.1 glyoxalase [Mammaliicoccus stepanovicii]GGI40705.1 glyoxalase [Mammaliicoccus stepanovicii]SNV57734.1 Glyoxalase [Mammaliicoccus stepanovicii]